MSARVKSYLIRDLLRCIQCGACASACPALKPLDLSPRRIVYKARSTGEIRLEDAWKCLQCSMCTSVCPQNIDVCSMLARVRREGEMPEEMKIVSSMVLEKGISLPPLRGSEYNVELASKSLTELLKWGCSLETSLTLSAIPRAIRFIVRSHIQELPKVIDGGRAYVYPGCIACNMYPSILESTIELLDRMGFKTILEKDRFVCCGLPLVSSGSASEELFAVTSSAILGRAMSVGADFIVTPCNGCLASILNGIAIARSLDGLTKEISEKASTLGIRVSWDLPVYNISDILPFRLNEVGAESDKNLAVFYGCHYRSILSTARIKPNALEEVVRILGRTPVIYERETGCCGGFTKTNIEVAHELSKNILVGAGGAGADKLLLQCNGCLMNMDRAAMMLRVAGENTVFAEPLHVCQYIMSVLKDPERYTRDLGYRSMGDMGW